MRLTFVALKKERLPALILILSALVRTVCIAVAGKLYPYIHRTLFFFKAKTLFVTSEQHNNDLTKNCVEPWYFDIRMSP
jgi:hypothetical protein